MTPGPFGVAPFPPFLGLAAVADPGAAGPLAPFGLGLAPPFVGLGAAVVADPLPVDLPAAVAAFYRSRPELAGAAELFQATAGTAPAPHVVFTVRRSPTTRLTSTSLWREAALAFEAYAPTVEAAEDLAALVAAAFKGATLEWAGGYAIPLVPADRMQAAERPRTRGGDRSFRAATAFVARCREER